MGGLRDVARRRILGEMVGEAVGAMREDEWALLVVDDVTTKVLSSSCTVTDLVERRVSLVENIAKRRQPLPNMSVIYFISPTRASITRLLADFKGRNPLYGRAFVYLSSKLPPAELERIRQSTALVSRLGALKELNLEFVVADSRSFTTHAPRTLERVFAEKAKASGDYDAEIEVMVRRLVSLFASLGEFPAIRFQAGKPPEDGDLEGAGERALIPQRVAVALYSSLSQLQSQNAGGFPSAETCELLVVDRGVDPVAPVIHEWTYECMCYDLLKVENNVFKYDIDTNVGGAEEREVVLGEQDPVWAELRHKHIAEASLILNEKMNYFKNANKLARQATQKPGHGGGDGLDTSDLRQMVESLPQYREQLKRLSLHIHIASTVNGMAKKMGLHEVGKLEQDLVYGNATSKEVIKLLGANPDMSDEDKVRLLMCYVGESHTHTHAHGRRTPAHPTGPVAKTSRLTRSIRSLHYPLSLPFPFPPSASLPLPLSLSFLRFPLRSRHPTLWHASSATHPEKLDNNRRLQWMKLAKLEAEEMHAIDNLEFLGVSVSKKGSRSSLTFGAKKKRRSIRKEHNAALEGEEQWQLSRFQPMLFDLLQDALQGELSQSTYPYVSPPSARGSGGGGGGGAGVLGAGPKKINVELSVRKNRTQTKSRTLNVSDVDVQQSKPLVVFIVGGMTRSEVRVAHKMAAQYSSNVILGSTSLDTPTEFLKQISAVSTLD